MMMADDVGSMFLCNFDTAKILSGTAFQKIICCEILQLMFLN
jgi:hypothetical protein